MNKFLPWLFLAASLYNVILFVTSHYDADKVTIAILFFASASYQFAINGYRGRAEGQPVKS